jgi:hypothetical protein
MHIQLQIQLVNEHGNAGNRAVGAALCSHPEMFAVATATTLEYALRLTKPLPNFARDRWRVARAGAGNA